MLEAKPYGYREIRLPREAGHDGRRADDGRRGRNSVILTARVGTRGSTGRSTASAESFRNCDPSGSLSNLRLAIPLSVVALRAV